MIILISKSLHDLISPIVMSNAKFRKLDDTDLERSHGDIDTENNYSAGDLISLCPSKNKIGHGTTICGITSL